MKKLFYQGKTGIAESKWKEKKLADFAINIGCANGCQFKCRYCYTQSLHIPQAAKTLIAEEKANGDIDIEDLAIYRKTDNLLQVLEKDLRNKKYRSGTVVFSTTVDPCADEDVTHTTIEAMKMVLNKTRLEIRVLSKSTNIKIIAEAFNSSNYKKRIMYGLSTGTVNESIRKAIEQNTSPVDDRFQTLHWLQDNGYRTYGMLCPILPSEIDTIGLLLDRIRPEMCEAVWAEIMNVRGSSYSKTKEALQNSNLDTDASAIEGINCEEVSFVYAKKLHLALYNELKGRNQEKKLYFLQYANNTCREHFQEYMHKGVILLSNNPEIDPEFENILRPLSKDEYNKLEESIVKIGCIDPILVWDKKIVDGHNRFKICSEYGIPFKQQSMSFNHRSEALDWIIQYQFARRNLLF